VIIKSQHDSHANGSKSASFIDCLPLNYRKVIAFTLCMVHLKRVYAHRNRYTDRSQQEKMISINDMVLMKKILNKIRKVARGLIIVWDLESIENGLLNFDNLLSTALLSLNKFLWSLNFAKLTDPYLAGLYFSVIPCKLKCFKCKINKKINKSLYLGVNGI